MFDQVPAVDLNMARSKAAATGKGATRWPKIQQKHGLAAEELHGQDIMQASSAPPAELTTEGPAAVRASLTLPHPCTGAELPLSG